MNGTTLLHKHQILSIRFIVLACVALFVGVFTLVPLFSMVWNSFKAVEIGQIADFSLQNFTLDNYFDAYGDSEALTMLANSFIFAFGSMIVAFIIGGGTAFLVERTNIP